MLLARQCTRRTLAGFFFYFTCCKSRLFNKYQLTLFIQFPTSKRFAHFYFLTGWPRIQDTHWFRSFAVPCKPVDVGSCPTYYVCVYVCMYVRIHARTHSSTCSQISVLIFEWVVYVLVRVTGMYLQNCHFQVENEHEMWQDNQVRSLKLIFDPVQFNLRKKRCSSWLMTPTSLIIGEISL